MFTVIQEQPILCNLLSSSSDSLSEEAQEQLDKALKEGGVNCKHIVGVITGSAGVGKTCTLCLLLKRPPPKDEDRESTGLVKPIRTVVVAKESSEFKELSTIEVLHEIAIRAKAAGTKQTSTATLDHINTQSGQASIATNDEAVSKNDNLGKGQQLDHMDIQSRQASIAEAVSKEDNLGKGQQLDHMDIQSGHASIPDSSQKWSTLPGELITKIKDIAIKMAELGPDQPPELDITFIYLFDSGGQPHFHELLQSFIPKVSVNIFVVNLSEPLTHHPKVFWYQKGKSLDESYDSPFSHEELLQRTIQAMRVKSKGVKILVAGTHRDINVKGGETIDQKNEKLSKILPDCGLIFNEGTHDLIYPLNAKDPEDCDKEVAKRMCKVITDCTPTVSKPIPLRWFLLLRLIQELGEMKEQKGMVSMVECQEIAYRLYIENFTGAIDYLANSNLILYYRDVLKDVVFSDPHVILNKVTKLVWFSCYLNSKKNYVPVVKMQDIPVIDWTRFINFGFLTQEHLKSQIFCNKEIIDDYGFDDLFTPADFLKLLDSLCIAAALEPSHAHPSPSTEYFLPCLRGSLECKEVKETRSRLQKVSAATPLLICFPGNWPPSGLFCKIAVSLLSTDGWKIRCHSKVPTCFYRNCLEYYVEQKSFVTLIDRLSLGFFEVYVEPCDDSKINVSYPTILGHLVKAINASWAKLHSLDSDVTAEPAFWFQSNDTLTAPKVAFICTGCKDTDLRPHPAYGGPCTETLYCSEIDGLHIEITAKHKLWAEEKNEHQTKQLPGAMPSQSDSSHLRSADPNYSNLQGQWSD